MAEGKEKKRRPSWVFGNAAGERALRWSLVPLRLMIGVIFIAHGAQKAFGWWDGSGYSGTVEMFSGMQFPAPGLFAVLLIVGELVGGLLLLVGLAPRLGAAAIAIIMVGALVTVHAQDGFFNTHVQQLILAGCITLIIGGGGEIGLQRSRPPKR